MQLVPLRVSGIIISTSPPPPGWQMRDGHASTALGQIASLGHRIPALWHGNSLIMHGPK